MSLYISKQDYREYNDDVTVHFEVTLTEENMNIAIQEEEEIQAHHHNCHDQYAFDS